MAKHGETPKPLRGWVHLGSILGLCILGLLSSNKSWNLSLLKSSSMDFMQGLSWRWPPKYHPVSIESIEIPLSFQTPILPSRQHLSNPNFEASQGASAGALRPQDLRQRWLKSFLQDEAHLDDIRSPTKPMLLPYLARWLIYPFTIFQWWFCAAIGMIIMGISYISSRFSCRSRE